MVIGIFGENCSGKSTLAAALREALGAQIISGKDYLRLAKSPTEAAKKFEQRLQAAVGGVAFLPEGAVRIRVGADLDTIKARFRERMHGVLPPPVEQMLERKHGVFDNVPADYSFDGAGGDAKALCDLILKDNL